MLPPNLIVHDPPSLLAAIRDLYSKHPEMHNLEAWEMQSALFVLGFTGGLAAEAAIAAAMEVARGDFDPEGEAA